MTRRRQRETLFWKTSRPTFPMKRSREPRARPWNRSPSGKCRPRKRNAPTRLRARGSLLGSNPNSPRLDIVPGFAKNSGRRNTETTSITNPLSPPCIPPKFVLHGLSSKSKFLAAEVRQTPNSEKDLAHAGRAVTTLRIGCSQLVRLRHETSNKHHINFCRIALEFLWEERSKGDGNLGRWRHFSGGRRLQSHCTGPLEIYQGSPRRSGTSDRKRAERGILHCPFRVEGGFRRRFE